MYKKYITSSLAILSLSASMQSNADWIDGPIEGVRDVKLNGQIVTRNLGIPHFSQTEKYTCGSTTTRMQIIWETYKAGHTYNFSSSSLYSVMNTSGSQESGLTTIEMKEGQNNIISILNNGYGLNVNVEMLESGDEDLTESIRVYFGSMMDNLSPAIMYGNVKFGSAGGHYYLIKGAVDCPTEICGKVYRGLFLNDSFYQSPAYTNIETQYAVEAGEFLNSDELETYWKETGSAIYTWWRKKHLFLYNSKTSM